MYSPNQVTLDHIKQLKDVELSKLLHILLNAEARKENLEGWDASVPFNVTTADAGSDGKMVWTGGPVRTKYLPNRFSMFQNKATYVSPAACYEEILEKKIKGHSRKLKDQIRKLVEADGCYILFTNETIVDNGKEERIKKFREAIRDAGHPNGDTVQIEVYDANKIKDWTNLYLNAVVYVQRSNGITRPVGFRTFDEWGVDIRESETPFQTNEIVNLHIGAIQKTIQTEKVIRISGHSGLGKTRLVYECFRPGTAGEIILPGLVYYDLGAKTNRDDIVNHLLSHRNDQEGLIIIDNCDTEAHEQLSKLIKSQGALKIVTIGFDDRRSIEDPKIKLDRNEQRDLVSLIVEQKIGTSHDTADKEYIKRLSEGYPWMAVKFCDNVLLKGMSNLSQYPLDEFIQKLLFGSAEKDKVEFAVVSACSVFSAFGFLDDSFATLINSDLAKSLQAQMDFIREQIYDGILSDSEFREICKKFRQEDIIEKRGTFYIVKPTVLAINLASHWLTKTAPGRIKTIIERLKNVGLDEKFIDRLTDLDQLDKAQDIVALHWGPEGFFGSAEVLSTSWGSLLFRYVVEVNPFATASALTEAFLNTSTEDLKNLTVSRRNLVWGLEKLVFRKQSFQKAAKVLYKFSVAENETWANNATGQFIHLFQLYLPGTEVNFQERLSIIQWGLQKKDDEFTRIAILGLGRGLLYDHFSRGGGAEDQGSGAPLKDYTPTNWQEISDYWKSILDLLIPLASENTPLGNLAKGAIVKAIRRMAATGKIELIDDAIRSIVSSNNEFWPDALEALKRTLDFEKAIPDSHQQIITNLINALTPLDLKTKLYLNVSKPEWSYSDPADFGGEKQVTKAKSLAETIIAENLPLDDLLTDLLQGEQRRGYPFGLKLGEVHPDPEPLIDKMIAVLQSIPKKDQNPEIFVAFVIGTKNQKLIESVYNSILANEKLAHHGFFFARVAQFDLTETEKLFDAVERFNLPISYFSSFQYGRAGDVFSVEEITRICTRLLKYGLPGRWIGLSILFMYCYSDNERFQQCSGVLKQLISGQNMMLTGESSHTMEAFHWSETVTKLLADKNDVDFAKTIMEQVVEMCSDYRLHSGLDHYVPKVMGILFEKYLEEIWDVFGNALIGSNYIFILNIKSAVGTKNGWMGGNGMLFQDHVRNVFIFEWCKKHPDIAPKRIASMMPLSVSIDGNIAWNPFTKQIIDTFGNQEGVLSELSANMGTYGSVGSRVGYLEMLKELVTQLLEHPIPEVSDWARRYLNYIEKDIKLEKIDNEEENIS